VGSLTDDEARRRAAAAPVARLATVDAVGRPHLVPVCFAFDGKRLVSAVDAKPKRTARLRRLDNIAANPAVEVLVDHYEDDWSALWWVRLTGQARVLAAGEARDSAVADLADKYHQYRSSPPTGPVVAVDVERITSWTATT
jgi:PPOX class probable F420-dependent enzyme